MNLEICLFSPSGSDERLIQFLSSIRKTDARFLVLSDDLGQPHFETALRNTGSVAQAYARTSLATWSLGVASLLMRDMREESRKAFIDVDFAAAQKLPGDAFLARSAEHDFYALSGRFDKDDGGFAFATWECCALSGALWKSQDFKTFLTNLAIGMNLDGRLYAERYFYEHFRKSFDIASVIGGEKSRVFDPLQEKRISIPKLLGA